jgi:hypothetical protein
MSNENEEERQEIPAIREKKRSLTYSQNSAFNKTSLVQIFYADCLRLSLLYALRSDQEHAMVC